MPTIGQLPAALSVSDSDEIPIFQNGQTVAATRAQLLAGLQPALAVPANTLLGAIAPGNAAPGPISIGANLTLSNNSLSANAAPFDIVALPSTNLPNASDLIPLGQGGVNKAISYAQFMAGLP
ncbi:MAG TPA: right-handed parallel beta-helix repeat-containing protein, partial [Acetobacteraceae bacterium]|nr:right-handed parallel beta-helix repeat-containing protein [Acetobacteraceae bacterium]